MTIKTFLKVLSDSFYPSLRDEGFRGSGATLRRFRAPLVHVVNVQGSSNAQGCYVNLGVHLEYLGTVSGRKITNLDESDCVFRTRLEPSDSSLLGRWQYGLSQDEAVKTAERISQSWVSEGRGFFSRYATYPESFEVLVADASAETMHPRDLWIYAKIAQHLGFSDRALELVNAAIPKVAPVAVSLRGNLKRLRTELEDA